jgi:hypothetical protein
MDTPLVDDRREPIVAAAWFQAQATAAAKAATSAMAETIVALVKEASASNDRGSAGH